MPNPPEVEAIEAVHEVIEKSRKQRYVLRLYVAGAGPRCLRAVQNIRRVCDEHLEGRYDLQVIDLRQQPQLAAGHRIVAIPTLIKKLPLPLRRIIGDMSNTERLLVGLDLQRRDG